MNSFADLCFTTYLIIHLFLQKRIELNYFISINLLASYRNMIMHAKLCIVWRESVAAPLIVSVYKTLIVTIKLCTVLYCTVLYCNVTIKHRILLTKLLSWHDWSPISWGATLTFTIIVLTARCTLGMRGVGQICHHRKNRRFLMRVFIAFFTHFAYWLRTGSIHGFI